MPNTTDTYWEIDGVSLQTYISNLETLEGRDTPPPMRGDNEVVPHRPGARWLPKVVDSRVIELAGWVIGVSPDGSTSRPRRDIFDDNWRMIRNLMFTPGRQFALKKRFKVNGALRSATAMGEYAGGMQPKMIGRTGAKFVVNIELADPYFYDDVETTTVLPNGTTNVTVLGDAPTQHIMVNIAGPRTNTKVRNNTLGIEFQHNQQLLTGARLEAYVREFTALNYPSGGAAQRVSASMIHAGAPHWLELRPGVNALAVSSSAGTGTVTMKHRGAWL